MGGAGDQETLGSATSGTGRELGYATAVRKAQDRDQWRSMVSKVPGGYGTHD